MNNVRCEQEPHAPPTKFLGLMKTSRLATIRFSSIGTDRVFVRECVNHSPFSLSAMITFWDEVTLLSYADSRPTYS